MRMVRQWIHLLVVATLLVSGQVALGQTFSSPVVVSAIINTSATDFPVVAALNGYSIVVQAIDIQNIGSATVTVKLCDGTCGTAANVKYTWKLAAQSAAMPAGMWSMRCPSTACAWVLTNGNALIAQVDTGATNNVQITVIGAVR